MDTNLFIKNSTVARTGLKLAIYYHLALVSCNNKRDIDLAGC